MILERDPLFRKEKQMNLSRPERYHLGLARAKALRRLSVKHHWDSEDDKMAEYLVDDVSPYMLHMSMFVTTVREQGSDAQRAFWLPKIENWEIIGAYAQTELGHGSNVRGLELQAKWDPKAREFVLNSPALTASKWWNGTLGRTANHAIVVAQLLLPDSASFTSPSEGEVQYKSHGPHPFIVQIRTLDTHQPLPRIIVGDIGPKYGYASMDNGYMLFNSFRIPHSALLCRYSRVDPATGAYTRTEGVNPAIVYGSLTAVRANIVMHARLVLARAVTVAVRYTAIRRQFADRDGAKGAPELPVLDYPTVQIRILPLLAATFALHYTGRWMQELYARTRAAIDTKNDFGRLAELHAASSGLKSLCTEIAANGIETCRRACGGHGFGGGSGLVQLNADYLSKPTVEGDNWMITQQTSAWLIKQMREAAECLCKSPSSSDKEESSGENEFKEDCRRYLTQRQGHSLGPVGSVLLCDTAIVEAFRRRALHQTYHLTHARILQKRSWNDLLIPLHKLAIAYAQFLLVDNFYNALSSLSKNKQIPAQLKSIVEKLFRLFALNLMDLNAREFSTCTAVEEAELDALQSTVQDLMKEIRPHAVNLVDAWSIPDFLLESALGRYDGRVYEELFRRAHKLNPLNGITFNPDWRSEEVVMGARGGIEEIKAKL